MALYVFGIWSSGRISSRTSGVYSSSMISLSVNSGLRFFSSPVFFLLTCDRSTVAFASSFFCATRMSIALVEAFAAVPEMASVSLSWCRPNAFSCCPFASRVCSAPFSVCTVMSKARRIFSFSGAIAAVARSISISLSACSSTSSFIRAWRSLLRRSGSAPAAAPGSTMAAPLKRESQSISADCNAIAAAPYRLTSRLCSTSASATCTATMSCFTPSSNGLLDSSMKR